MKILIATDWYKPVINGVVTSVDNLATGLEAAGHEVRILTLSGDIHPHKAGNVYYVRSISAGVVYENARLRLKISPEIMQDILEWQPDVIHTQCEFSTFTIAKKIASECAREFMQKVPIVHTYHTVYEDYTHYFCINHAMGKRIAKIFTRKVLSGVDAVIVPSDKMETMLLGYGIKKKIYSIPSGINTDRYVSDRSENRKRIRDRLGIAPDECTLIYVGRLAKEKNLDEILEFLAHAGTGQRMLVVGDGPYREDLEKKAESLGIRSQLIFTGMIPPEHVADYYAAGDIFISASNSETQGLTYMEAMLSALPLLCKADDCLEGVITDGVNGLIYHDEQDFDESLRRLNAEPEYRKELGLKARRSMQDKYSIQAFANACLRVYEDAIGQRA